MKEIEVNYIGLPIELKKQVITEEQLAAIIQGELKAAAKKELVSTRETQNGDEIILDYAGFVADEQFEGGTAEKQSLVLGSHTFIPGFEEQCLGKCAGDCFDVNVTFPSEYHASNLAGKNAVFHCKIHSIFRDNVPELNDEFVKTVSKCSSVEEYREFVRKEAQRSLDNQARFEARDELMRKMMEDVEISVSKEVINAELDVMMAELSDQLTLQGIGLEQYLEHTGKTRDFIRAQMLTDAIYRVRLNLTLEHIAEKENIEITEEEVDEVIKLAAGQYGMTPEEARESIGEIGMEGFKQDLLRQKVENFILDHADIKLV